MRCIDADKLKPDCLTKDGKLAISQSQIANAPTVEERPQCEFAKLLNERIDKHVCKWCQMNKHCELCEISRVFMIIDLTDKEMNEGGAKG